MRLLHTPYSILQSCHSKEGVNRAERGGKEKYARPIGEQGPLGVYTVPLASNAKKGGGSLVEGAKGAGGYLGDWLGGGSKDAPKK